MGIEGHDRMEASTGHVNNISCFLIRKGGSHDYNQSEGLEDAKLENRYRNGPYTNLVNMGMFFLP